MILLKILFIVLFYCVLPVVIILKIWAHFATLHTEKRMNLEDKSYYPTFQLKQFLNF